MKMFQSEWRIYTGGLVSNFEYIGKIMKYFKEGEPV